MTRNAAHPDGPAELRRQAEETLHGKTAQRPENKEFPGTGIGLAAVQLKKQGEELPPLMTLK